MRAPEALPVSRLSDGLLSARRGRGPLFQRDYWAVIDRATRTPHELVEVLRRHFERFPPEDLVVFRRRTPAPLEVGDELSVHIVGAGEFGVRVLHRDAQSLTLGTLAGHPEAGRITFGAYRNRRGDVLFHIRSRARSSTRFNYVGFLGAGEPMQTNTWTTFVNRVAVFGGQGVLGWIHAETTRCGDEPDEVSRGAPTYFARGA